MNPKRALLVFDMIGVYIFGEKPLISITSRDQLIGNIKFAIKIAHLGYNISLKKLQSQYFS